MANDTDACIRFLPTTLQSSLIFYTLLHAPINFAVAYILCPPFPTLSAFPKFAVVINETANIKDILRRNPLREIIFNLYKIHCNAALQWLCDSNTGSSTDFVVV
jgi:hypothetical protein